MHSESENVVETHGWFRRRGVVQRSGCVDLSQDRHQESSGLART